MSLMWNTVWTVRQGPESKKSLHLESAEEMQLEINPTASTSSYLSALRLFSFCQLLSICIFTFPSLLRSANKYRTGDLI